MTTADRIAAALRPIAPGGRLTNADVARINAMARAWDGAGRSRRISAAGLNLIKQFEGLRFNAYPDPATNGDPWTIGYGHTGPEVHKGLSWTAQQAEDALVRDVSRFEDGVYALIEDVPTSQGEFDALVSFAFNLGLGALGKSTLLKLHRAGDKADAANEFGKWVNAAGRKMPGLVKRRAAEAALYRGRA